MKKNKTKNLLILLLAGFVTLAPMATVTACNKGLQADEQSNTDINNKLLDQIKFMINDQFRQKEWSILDYKSFAGLTEVEFFQILENYYKEMTDTNNIKINNSQITQYFINKINKQLKILNTRLKNLLIKFQNLPFDIVSIETNNLFLEKITYDQIMDVIGKIDKDNNYNYYNNSPTPKIFKLKLNLTFKIKIDNMRELNYAFPEMQYFVTDNTNDIFGKLSNISDSLRPRLQDSKISLEKVRDYSALHVPWLNERFIATIKENFNSKNPELNLKFDTLSTPIKEEDLRINLKSLKHTNSDGITANAEGIKNYEYFINTIIKSDVNFIKSMYFDNSELKKVNSEILPTDGPVNIKTISYMPLNLSINDINIPMVEPIRIVLTLEYNNFINYLKEFRAVLEEYLTLIKAGEVEFIGDASRKVVEVFAGKLSSFPKYKDNPLELLIDDFYEVKRGQLRTHDSGYFNMNFKGNHYLKNAAQGTHSGNVTVDFTFKAFAINFLDNEQLRFTYDPALS